MKKILFVIIVLFSFSSLNADYLKLNSNYCVIDYWYGDGGILYYIKSSTPDVVDSRSYKDTVFISGYVYDSSNDICYKDPQLLGLTKENFEFTNAMIALIVGFLLIWSFF
jgi:hypothetical protein